MGFNRVYDEALARSIRNIFKRYFSTTCFCFVSAFINSISRFPQFHFNPFVFYRHILLFEDIGGEYNIPLALNARQVRDFDEGLTRGMLVTAIRESVTKHGLLISHFASLQFPSVLSHWTSTIIRRAVFIQ